MLALNARHRGIWLALAALSLLGCGDDSGKPTTSQEAKPGVRRISFARTSAEDPATSVEVAGHVEPAMGVDTWEVVSPEWNFEDSGARKRPLRLTGQGKKLVTIPGPFERESFDRITVTVENPVRGSMLATLKMEGGQELQSRVDVPKGRHRHPVTFKLPRAVSKDEAIEALVLYFDLKRAVTIHEIDFGRQPLLATLPSPEAGAALVTVGSSAHRAVGLGATQTLQASWSGDRGLNATVWVAGMRSDKLWTDDDAKVTLRLVQTEPSPGEPKSEPVSRSVSLLPGWTPVSFLGLDAGSYHLDVSLELLDEGTTALISEVGLVGPAAAKPKTVVLVTSGTHRADHLGTTNSDAGTPIETPHLDELAANGLLFESAWATSNISIPSHSALLTGRHPRDTKVLDHLSSLGADPDASPRTLAEEFAAMGYATAAILSSSHLAAEYSGLGRGFDTVIHPDESRARAAASVATALAQLRGGTPTFVWLHLSDAHGPFHPEAQYRAEIAYLDEQLGTLFENPRVAAGVVAFTADHGEAFARNGLFYGHERLAPDTLRVPLILRAPGIRNPGERVSFRVRQMDVGRTLLNLAGHGDVDFPGQFLLRPEASEETPTFALSRRFASVTDGEWHAVLALADFSGSDDGRVLRRHQIEVFDLSEDPGCLKDLAEENVEVAARYRADIVEWLAGEDIFLRGSRPSLDRAAMENLVALGYGGDAVQEAQLFDAGCSCNECLKFK
jgi:arylsulfatase